MPGNYIVAYLHYPPERPLPEEGGGMAISEHPEDIETRLPALQEVAIRKPYVQRLLTVAGQFGRHGGRREILERDDL